MRGVTMELELVENEVSGTFFAFRQELDLSGSFDRASKEMNLAFEVRGNRVEIKGALKEDGNYEAKLRIGPLGEVELVAKRTVDKSKKPEPKPEEKDKPKPKDDPKPKPKDDPKPKDEPKPKEGPKPDKKEVKKEAKPEEKKEEKKEEAKKPEAKKEEPKSQLKPPKKPSVSKSLEPYRDLFAGKLTAFVSAKDLYSIKAAAELFSKKYKLKTVIVGADDLARDPSILDGYEVSVIAGPKMTVQVDKQPGTNLPQLFATEQLTFGFQSLGTTGSGQLPGAVQFAVSQGLAASDAVAALTGSPAKMLGDQVNFGMLQKGKDADLVVLSGPPFEYSTRILAVMIDGVWVYEREEQK